MSATLYDIILNDGTTGYNIRQVQSSDFTPNNTIERGRTSAAVLSSKLFFISGEPRYRWSTTDVAGMLTAMSPSAGMCVSSGLATVPFAVRGCGGIAAGSSHVSLTGSKFFAVLRSMIANQQDAAARMEGELAYLSSNGFAVPVTWNTGQALASAAFNAEHRLGPVYFNSTLIPKVTGVSVDFGVTFDLESTDGGNYPVTAFLNTVEPSFTIRFRNEASFAALGPVGASMTNATIYLRKKLDGESYVAGGTAEHVSLSLGAGLSDVLGVSASGMEFGEFSVKLTGHQITAATNATIS